MSGRRYRLLCWLGEAALLRSLRLGWGLDSLRLLEGPRLGIQSMNRSRNEYLLFEGSSLRSARVSCRPSPALGLTRPCCFKVNSCQLIADLHCFRGCASESLAWIEFPWTLRLPESDQWSPAIVIKCRTRTHRNGLLISQVSLTFSSLEVLSAGEQESSDLD
jgi:hypothetical protein